MQHAVTGLHLLPFLLCTHPILQLMLSLPTPLLRMTGMTQASIASSGIASHQIPFMQSHDLTSSMQGRASRVPQQA